MIFIFEQQIPFFRSEDKKYWKASAYREACLIYKALYLLKAEDLNLIDEVCFLSVERIDEAVYMDCFKHYLADVRSYSFDKHIICEIMHEFPDIDQLIDSVKKKKIEDLIAKIKIHSAFAEKTLSEFVMKVSNSLETSMIFLPYIKLFSKRLLNESDRGKIQMYSDKKSLKGYSDKEYILVDSGKYLEIQETLDKIRPVVLGQLKEFNTVPGQEFLEYFGNEFLMKILDLKNSKRKSRFHLYGKDRLIAKKVIEKIMQNADYRPYYFPEDLHNVQRGDKSIVIYNFDSLKESGEYRAFFSNIIQATKAYIILQAYRNINSPYFEKFVSIELPDVSKYEGAITNIFLGFLLGGYKYTDQKLKLGSFHGNVLKDLIPKTGSLEDLFNAVVEVNDIKFDDLINNAGFWYYVYLKVKEKQERMLSADTDKIKKRVTIEKVGDSWMMYNQGKLPQISFIGMLYLTIILQSHNKFHKALTTTEIRNIAIRYTGDKTKIIERENIVNNTDYYEMLESDRKAISGAFTNKEYGLYHYEQLKTFIKKHLECKKHKYNFNDQDEIQIEILDPKLEDSLFTSQYSARKVS